MLNLRYNDIENVISDLALFGNEWRQFLAISAQFRTVGSVAIATATAKCSLPFATTFARGILCNWLVRMAVYMASACASLAGKMVAVWFIISAFVALGLEHSVANMFIIPLGIMRGANVSAMDFLTKEILPVTIGNILRCTVTVCNGIERFNNRKLEE